MALGSDEHNSNEIYQPCERRFRTSAYFLQDQMRCSEAVEDFRSIRNLIQRVADFQPKTAFQFQSIIVPTE